MNRFALAVLAPFAAGVTAWMLSGSPLPMALGIILLVIALSLGALQPSAETRDGGAARRFAFGALVAAAGLFEFWLFREGRALAPRSQLPAMFHAGVALLWLASGFVLLSPRGTGKETDRRSEAQIGLLGGLIVLATSLATDRYDFGPWQVLPLAALPAAGFALLGFAPSARHPGRLAGTAVVAAFALATLAIGLDIATGRLADYFDDDRESERLTLRAPERGSAESDAGPVLSRRLPRKIDLHFDDRVRLYLRTGSAELHRSWMREPVYVRTSTVAVFESDEVIAPIRSGRWIYDDDDGELDQAISLDGATGRTERPRRYTMFIERDTATALPLLRNSSAVRTDALYEYADDWYQLAPMEGVERLRYTAELSVRRQDTTPGPSKRLRRPGAPGVYLNLPPSPLAARITRLCGAFADDEILASIRSTLRERASYALSYETPPGESPVEHLLFGDGAGHCELYAAATVMMLRGADIPARLAYGYAGGLADPERKLIALRDRDAHAWAEILTPEGDWLVFDTAPTAAAAGAENGVGVSRRPRPAEVASVDWDSYRDFSAGAEETTRRDPVVMAGIDAALAFLSRHFLLLTGGGFALGALAWGLRRRGGAEAENPLSGSRAHDPDRFVPGFLRELEACGERLGHPPRPGLTWREYLETLEARRPLPPVFTEAVDHYYGVAYAGKPTDPDRESALARRIREWHAALTEMARD